MAVRTPNQRELLETLSQRQREVLALVARGRTNGEIADALDVTLDTAKYHVGEILNKLNVNSREEAAAAWRAHRSASGRARRWMSALAGLPLGLKLAGGGVAVAGLAGAGLGIGFVATNGDDPGTGLAATATVDPWPGQAPQLGPSIRALYPEHGGSIAWVKTHTLSGMDRNGICFDTEFIGLPDTIRSFRMEVDSVDVTASMTWYVQNRPVQDTNDTDRQLHTFGARGCYTADEGIARGRHEATVIVRKTQDPASPVSERVEWSFEVSP